MQSNSAFVIHKRRKRCDLPLRYHQSCRRCSTKSN